MSQTIDDINIIAPQESSFEFSREELHIYEKKKKKTL